MLHRRRKGLGIGLGRCFGQRSQNGKLLPFRGQRQRKTFRVPFHPGGRIAGNAVLPAGEPDKNQFEAVFPGAQDHVVHGPEVEDALFRFHLLPRNGADDSVHARLLQRLPDGLHICLAGGRGVLQFAAEHQERFPVHDKPGSVRRLLQRGGTSGLFRSRRTSRCSQGHEGNQPLFHNVLQSSMISAAASRTGPYPWAAKTLTGRFA